MVYAESFKEDSESGLLILNGTQKVNNPKKMYELFRTIPFAQFGLKIDDNGTKISIQAPNRYFERKQEEIKLEQKDHILQQYEWRADILGVYEWVESIELTLRGNVCEGWMRYKASDLPVTTLNEKFELCMQNSEGEMEDVINFTGMMHGISPVVEMVEEDSCHDHKHLSHNKFNTYKMQFKFSVY